MHTMMPSQKRILRRMVKKMRRRMLMVVQTMARSLVPMMGDRTVKLLLKRITVKLLLNRIAMRMMVMVVLGLKACRRCLLLKHHCLVAKCPVARSLVPKCLVQKPQVKKQNWMRTCCFLTKLSATEMIPP